MGLNITRKTLLISETGGKIDVINADGETVHSAAVPAGSTPARKYFGLVPAGGHLLPAKGVTLYEPPGGVSLNSHGAGKYEVGANPDYQPPSNAQKLEEQMRATVQRASKAAKRLEARAAAYERLERIQPAPEPVELIEPVEIVNREAQAE